MYKVGEEIRMSVEEAQKIIDFGVDSVGYWELRSLAFRPTGMSLAQIAEYEKLISDLKATLNDLDEPLSDSELLEKCGTGELITDADVGIKRSWWDCLRNK